MDSWIELPCYETPTGRIMVLCECRIKVRLSKEGRLVRHWAFDGRYRQDGSDNGMCVHVGKKFEVQEGEVLGIRAGRLEL